MSVFEPNSPIPAGKNGADQNAAGGRASLGSLEHFHSILYPDAAAADHAPAALDPQLPLFRDLHLDAIFDQVLAGRRDYALEPVFRTPLRDLRVIAYRQEVMRDLENPSLADILRRFATGMREMRKELRRAEAMSHPEQKQAWFLEAVRGYCETLLRFESELRSAPLRSAGLCRFRGYLADHVSSRPFLALQRETRELALRLAGVRYGLHIAGDRIRVGQPSDDPDYAREVRATFAIFERQDGDEQPVAFAEPDQLNHVEYAILQKIVRRHRALFDRLARFSDERAEYADPTVLAFDREIQFYLAWLEHLASLRRAGLACCYPRLLTDTKEVRVRAGFDLALASRLRAEGGEIVCNDFHLSGEERVLVVSGPNQGGKTTFARMFGQLHYLASLGCPVAAREARLFLFDRLFTQFEKAEDPRSPRSKLEDDLLRIREILEQATGDSIILLNEIFSSTTLADALFLNREILSRIIARDALCVCVTFLEELARLGPQTVSMVSTVAADDPTRRTFRLERLPADGLAHALSLAERHGLTYARLVERIPP